MKKLAFYLVCLMTFYYSSVFAEENINVAAIYALTGEAAKGNATSLQGVRLGVEDVNREGGVLGRKINLMIFDNFSTPLGSDIAAEKAAKAGVSCILGASWSTHSLAIARVAQERGVPMISNVSTHPDVTKVGNYIFRVCFTDDFQGNVMARFARQDLKASTAVVFTNLTSDYSLKLSEIFQKNFKDLGGKILLEAEYKQRQEKFDKLIIRARDADPDILFLSGHDESGSIIRKAQYAGIKAVPLGGDGWGTHVFMSKGGSELKRGYYCSHWSNSSDSEVSRLFIKKHKDFYKSGVATVLGYDAVKLMADAIRRAGSADRAKIREALENTLSFEGVTGTISFDANGDPIKSAVIMEIRNGDLHYFKTLKP